MNVTAGLIVADLFTTCLSAKQLSVKKVAVLLTQNGRTQLATSVRQYLWTTVQYRMYVFRYRTCNVFPYNCFRKKDMFERYAFSRKTHFNFLHHEDELCRPPFALRRTGIGEYNR